MSEYEISWLKGKSTDQEGNVTEVQFAPQVTWACLTEVPSDTNTGSFQVGTTQIKDGAITGAKIAAGAISSTSQLAEGIIAGKNIKEGTVGASRLCSKSIKAAQIENGSLTTELIQDGAITKEKLFAPIGTLQFKQYIKDSSGFDIPNGGTNWTDASQVNISVGKGVWLATFSIAFPAVDNNDSSITKRNIAILIGSEQHVGDIDHISQQTLLGLNSAGQSAQVTRIINVTDNNSVTIKPCVHQASGHDMNNVRISLTAVQIG